MPNINLIAARREEKKKLESLTRQLFFGALGSLGVLVALGSYLVTQRLIMSTELEQAEARMKKVQPDLNEIARIKKEMGERTPKVETLELARKSTLRWCALFQSVARSLPSGTWVTRLDSAEGDSTKGDPIRITMSGLANSQTAVGETATLLGRQPLLEGVNIVSSQSATSVGDSALRVSFEIEAMMKGLTPPPPPPPADGGAPAQTAQAPGGDKGNG